MKSEVMTFKIEQEALNMRNIKYSNQFKKDVTQSQKRGKNISKLRAVMQLIISGQPLPAVLKDHQLKGALRYHRELHIEPDWLLVYIVGDESVCFERTGTHSDLFK